MKKFVKGMLLATIAIALFLAGCEDEKDIIPPTTVTLSGGNSNTGFNTFVFAAFSLFGIEMLFIMGANASDTLIIATFSFGALDTDSPIALNDTLIGIAGTLGGGQTIATSGPGATGTLTFTRLDTLGFVSGEFSDKATLLGITADNSEVTVSISGGFAAVGGNVDIIDILSKQLLLLPSPGEQLIVPFD